MLSQFWDCLFKVTVVDCVIRLMGFTGKGIVLLTHPSQPEECFRRRAQVSHTHCTSLYCRDPWLGSCSLALHRYAPAPPRTYGKLAAAPDAANDVCSLCNHNSAQ